MAENERPLSELISSIKQQDFTPSEDISTEEAGTPKGKKSKAFPIIVSILLVLILVVGGYYVYINYIKEQEPIAPGTTPEEVPDLGYGDMFIELSNRKVIYVKVPTSDCDTTGYKIVEQERDKMTIWEDNQEGVCSSGNILGYFTDEEVITEYYSDGNAVYPLEKYTENGIVYEYISKDEYSEESMAVGGVVYQKEPTVSVNEYEAFVILNFKKNFPELDEENQLLMEKAIIEGSTINTYCVFDLSKIIDNGEGYLVFSGYADVGSAVNYCEILENSENFVIEEKNN